MESRHLYRGKRIDNGEWAIGFYLNPLEEYGNGERVAEIVPLEAIQNFECVSPTLIVDPSTICQCTGLKDDDGTLIFENDVLSLKDEISKCEWKAVVKFGNPNSEYTWGWQLVSITECDVNKDILMWVETEMGYMYCNIIGNGFDNPEQLKGVSYDEK